MHSYSYPISNICLVLCVQHSDTLDMRPSAANATQRMQTNAVTIAASCWRGCWWWKSRWRAIWRRRRQAHRRLSFTVWLLSVLLLALLLELSAFASEPLPSTFRVQRRVPIKLTQRGHIV
jgi:hypothetical protein